MNTSIKPAINRRRMINSILITAAAGLFLTIIAPLGTSYLAFGERLVYWVGLCFAGWVGGMLAEYCTDRYLPNIPKLLQLFLNTMAAACCVFVALITFFQHLSISASLVTFFYVFVISLAITGVGAAFKKQDPIDVSTESKVPALLDRLPVEMRKADIYAISAEDHYVKVHTSQGHTMILMRFKDAVRDASPLKGLVTHRSWWVAEQGVKSIKKKSRSADLTLKNDELALVSRNGLKALRESGWVD